MGRIKSAPFVLDMKRRSNEPARIALSSKGRKIFSGLGLLLLLTGVSHLYGHRLEYHNYWGGDVFAPFTILIALLFFAVALFARRKEV
jgi:hypothetical protein